MKQAAMRGAPDTADALAFNRVLCGIDGSWAALEAVSQAVTLAAPGACIELLGLASERGYGPNAQALLSQERAMRALHEAQAYAAELGSEVVISLSKSASPPHALLEAARDQDLLVLASHGESRAGGIMIGDSVSRAIHESTTPVLVARRPPTETRFPARIVVGAGGPGAPQSAVVYAAFIARTHGADVVLVRVDGLTHLADRALMEAWVELAEATGVEPVEVIAAGEPHARLVDVATREHASLVVVGSRRLTGLRSLFSTSERVAHEAPCSVLVVRH
jgi:nucleotide-binding universal stress UspA family protein